MGQSLFCLPRVQKEGMGDSKIMILEMVRCLAKHKKKTIQFSQTKNSWSLGPGSPKTGPPFEFIKPQSLRHLENTSSSIEPYQDPLGLVNATCLSQDVERTYDVVLGSRRMTMLMSTDDWLQITRVLGFEKTVVLTPILFGFRHRDARLTSAKHLVVGRLPQDRGEERMSWCKSFSSSRRKWLNFLENIRILEI